MPSFTATRPTSASILPCFPNWLPDRSSASMTLPAQITQRCVRIQDFAEGVERFITGLGKKAFIANQVTAAHLQS
jgi:hypothetical protein